MCCTCSCRPPHPPARQAAGPHLLDVAVVLAELLSAPLVTADGKLAKAHGHHARIELL